jgi:hypothetical protein
MSKTIDTLAAINWLPFLELDGATFSNTEWLAGLWRRQRPRDDGSTETRYAWDGDGRVVATLGEIAEAIDGPRFAAGDDARGAIGGDD